MDWAVKLDKPFFVGQRALQAIQRKPLRQKLVGFKLPAGLSGAVPQECHLIIERGEIAGRVTSIAFSPNLGHHIGLAFIHPGLAKPGQFVEIRLTDGSLVGAEVCKTPFFDPTDERQKDGREPPPRPSAPPAPRTDLLAKENV